MSIIIPADVPADKKEHFVQNYTTITKNTERLFIFSCDHKIEHLHDDFNPSNDDVPQEAIDPEHFFKIGSQGRIGALATHLELIARYAPHYPNIPYIAKLNAKTNLIPETQKDPESAPLWEVKDAIHLIQKGNVDICGVGITVYLGSEFEHTMLQFAAKSIFEAHKVGLLAMVWMYPRGKAITDETDPHLIAGAAGAADSLGADIIKIKPPHPSNTQSSVQLLQTIVQAAGNSKVICSGGNKKNPHAFLQELYEQINIGHTAGTAIGRNIFQNTLPKAIQMTKAIAAIVYDDASVDMAMQFVD